MTFSIPCMNSRSLVSSSERIPAISVTVTTACVALNSLMISVCNCSALRRRNRVPGKLPVRLCSKTSCAKAVESILLSLLFIPMRMHTLSGEPLICTKSEAAVFPTALNTLINLSRTFSFLLITTWVSSKKRTELFKYSPSCETGTSNVCGLSSG